MADARGWIVLLNGVPRSGKSSIARTLASSGPEPWLQLGVDAMAEITPPSLRPGIGLRPGGERPDLEDAVRDLFSALFESVAACSRLGFAMVVDVGIHDDYTKPLGVWRDAAARLEGLPVLVVGVRCPLEVVLARRATAPEGRYEASESGEGVPKPVARWEEAVHRPGVYDVEVDTSVRTPQECADVIRRALDEPAPTALIRLGR